MERWLLLLRAESNLKCGISPKEEAFHLRAEDERLWLHPGVQAVPTGDLLPRTSCCKFTKLCTQMLHMVLSPDLPCAALSRWTSRSELVSDPMATLANALCLCSQTPDQVTLTSRGGWRANNLTVPRLTTTAI